ncbi:MAG: methionine gamma-lyase [Oscillospiraceae bacterium]|nr:methionine gamma-lyase [Oscillospiraceae bacterium]
MDYTTKGWGTKAVHAGNVKDTQYGALTTPIYQTSTFIFENCAQGAARFEGTEPGYIYTRLGNPTTSVLEAKIAALDGAEATLATSSGMGAISSVFWTITHSGAHVIADETLYGCTWALLSHGLTRFGVEVSLIDTSDIENVKAALKPNTVAVYLETPANPNLKITDIEEIAKAAHEYNSDIKVICDNTFASPYVQRPLSLGADVLVYSATKYLNGHGDVIAGFVSGKTDFINQVRMVGVKDMTGSVLGPQEAFLILRGLKTFEVRMERLCSTAAKVAEFLNSHPKIERVYYPGLESHPNHEVAKKQMRNFGAMMSFIVKGGKPAGEKLLNSLELCTLAVSLGSDQTLIEHPASMTHSTYDPQALVEAGVPAGLVRLSVGLENVEDIIEDLAKGLELI